MPLEHQQTLIKMVQKHQENYEGMKKDKKLNIYFWTKNQIEKKLNQFEKLTESN